MLYGTLFMLCGAYTLAQNAHVRGDFLYSLDAAAHPGGARPRALHRVLPARHRRADLCRLCLRRGFLAHQRALQRHRGRPAGLSLQVHHSDRGRADLLQGVGRDHPLRRLPEDRRMAEPARRTSPRSTSSRSSSRTANTSTRNRASSRSRARSDIDEMRAAARHGRRPAAHERSGTRPADAGAHRRRHHDGLPHGLHADGPWHVLRLLRLLRPVAALDRQPASST